MVTGFMSDEKCFSAFGVPKRVFNWDFYLEADHCKALSLQEK